MENIKNNPMYSFLMILTVCGTAGLQAWVILFDNFAINTAGLTAYHVGILQSIREIPGFLAMFAVFILLVIREHRLASLSILCLGAGVFATGLFPTFPGLIGTTLISSLGYHYFETARQSLTLQYFDRTQTPTVIGRQISMGAATSIIVGLCIYFGANWVSSAHMYMLFGAAILLISLCLFFTRNPTKKCIQPQKKGMVLKSKYWLFYALTFMGGARRQIFIAFAAFLLVQKFKFTIQDISLLFLINNGINYFVASYVGRIIPRFGERAILSVEYIMLIVVFVSYAFVQSKTGAICLYILDHVLFNFSIAITTYFQKIADPEDIAPSAAVGFTINHIAAVILPVAGGYLWMVDYRIPFLGGALLGLVSLCMAQFIRTEPQHASSDAQNKN